MVSKSEKSGEKLGKIENGSIKEKKRERERTNPPMSSFIPPSWHCRTIHILELSSPSPPSSLLSPLELRLLPIILLPRPALFVKTNKRNKKRVIATWDELQSAYEYSMHTLILCNRTTYCTRIPRLTNLAKPQTKIKGVGEDETCCKTHKKNEVQEMSRLQKPCER
jgi:hypothetical protein